MSQNLKEDNEIQYINDFIEILPFLISGVPLLIAIIFFNYFELSLFIAVPLFIFAFIFGVWLLFYTIENKKNISDKITSICSNVNKLTKLFFKFLYFIFASIFLIYLFFFSNPRV